MITPKSWGYEEEIVNVEYCGKRMLVKDGHRCSIHSHKAKDEVLYVADGLLWFEAGSSPAALSGFWMTEQDRIRVKPGTWHRFSAVSGDATIFEFSTHHEDSDSIREIPGGKVPDDEYQGLVASYVRSASEHSVISLDEARAISDDVRARGGVVGMCNGCFDLIHMGHVELFKGAKSRCSTLFVAVNSDNSVRALKGRDRPFVPQEARAMLVALNKFVDYVVISEETTCLKVVDAVRPQVYVTTTEYGDKGPEAREVLRVGGQVEVVGLLPGYNTTKVAELVSSRK
jgi:rfaE bifunctional protein nucleotidyltransferase chain/domain